jgi:hypothetical protein
MTNNYLNPGRRVRPTSPKLSSAQRDVLQELSDDSASNLGVSGSTIRWIDYSDKYRWPYAACRISTFRSLLKRKYIEECGTDGDFTLYRITDTGRAALVAAGGL